MVVPTPKSRYGSEADVIAGKGIYSACPIPRGSVWDGCFWREARGGASCHSLVGSWGITP